MTPCHECSFANRCIGYRGQLDATPAAHAEVKQYAVRAKDRVIAPGQRVTGVLVLRKGAVKTCLNARDGREQVVGFQFPGEIIGLEAIHPGHHRGETIALENSEFCHLSIDGLVTVIAQSEVAQRLLLLSMSLQLNRATELAADLTAEERIAMFVLDLGERLSVGQEAANAFHLAMSRRDMANHLRLAAETVSRVLAKFRARGWLELDGRVVRSMDSSSLGRLRRNAPGGH